MNDVPQTELRNPRTNSLDRLPSSELVTLLAREQSEAVAAVVAQGAALAKAVDEIAMRLASGGNLHYVGAGSSGRIAFLDASEMPPTFGTDPSLVCAHIAGGPAALTRAVEGAEDNGDAGAHAMLDHIAPADVVIGLSASGMAPYVIAALLTARGAGAWTIAITNSPDCTLSKVTDQSIVLETGAEPLAGSTRLKAGTAQKLVLNAISTGGMVRLGHVYSNLMIDMPATNEKLRSRAVRMVELVAGVTRPMAVQALREGEGNVRLASVIARKKISAPEAKRLLQRQTLREVLGQ